MFHTEHVLLEEQKSSSLCNTLSGEDYGGRSPTFQQYRHRNTIAERYARSGQGNYDIYYFSLRCTATTFIIQIYSKISALLLTLIPLAAAIAIPQASSYGVAFGNAFSTGPVADNSFIRQSTTTLVLPELNKPHVGNMALWPGMGTSGGDLIQGLAISTVGGGPPCNMGADELKWCITASTLEENQEDGDVVTASPGDKVTYDYKYNDDTAKYDQTVSVNGKVTSTLSTDSGHALGWGTAIECQMTACGTVPKHTYVNTTLIMNVADPDYVQTLGLTNAEGDLTTSDGGKTWSVDTITIDEFTFT